MSYEIPLTKGYVAKVSREDYEWASSFKWCATDCTNKNITARKVYGIRRVGVNEGREESRVYLHREIMRRILASDGLTEAQIDREMEDKVVDHGDGDSLNNTRANLWLMAAACNSRDSAWRTNFRRGKAKKKYVKRGRGRHRRCIAEIETAIKEGRSEAI